MNYTTIIKQKKHLKVHPLNVEKFLMELKGKLCQSSVNGLLNNSSSVNPLTLSQEKCSSETTNQDGHCHGYALFPFSV